MADSWEDAADQPPPPRQAPFNVNAPSFVPRASAPAFVPGQAFNYAQPPPPPRAAAQPPPPPPAAAVQQQQQQQPPPPPPPAAAQAAAEEQPRSSTPEPVDQPSAAAVSSSSPAQPAAEASNGDVAELAAKTEQLSVDSSSQQEQAAPAAAEPIPDDVPVDESRIMDAYKRLMAEDPRDHLNVVFIGHVDAGKSTLGGQILFLTGGVDKRTIEKYEREAKDKNRESWYMAYIMDTNEEERVKGITVEVGRAKFETEARRYTILDAPGHKNYVPNMIMGAAQVRRYHPAALLKAVGLVI